MKTEKLSAVDAFVVFDIESAEQSVGITRLAPKVLVDGATWLARTETYRYASLGMKVGGASAGINVKAARPELPWETAVGDFVAEVEPWVSSGRLLTLPGKGLSADDLAALRAADDRPDLLWSDGAAITAAGVLGAARAALPGGLEGRTVGIEGHDVAGSALSDQLLAAGVTIRAVSIGKAGAIAPDGSGFTADQLAAGLDLDVSAGVALAAPVDLLFVGSKAGVVDHVVAADVVAAAVVPYGPIPVTAKALATLQRSGTTVLPDFITTAGLAFVDDDATVESASRAAADAIAAGISTVLDAEDGPLLGACRRAEAFLATWVDPLPFGRPIA